MAETTERVKLLWQAQRRQYALWCPVLIATGIGMRFGFDGPLPFSALLAALGCACFAGLYSYRKGKEAGTIAGVVTALLISGALVASLRIASVDAPVLAGTYNGHVEGRIIAVERARSGAPRVVLDHLEFAGLHPVSVPAKIRLTLVDVIDVLPVGSRISAKATVSAPSGPAAPGAFDFSRQAYFRKIGGVGYARGVVTVTAPAMTGELQLQKLRAGISRALQSEIGGVQGEVAAALIVGDRAKIPDETITALRDSGLAHLLAISGLHIGLMSALMYWLVRFCLAMLPVFASRFPIRKIAAVTGVIAAAAYLALSGAGVATQRAFIMATVAFGAILLDRPAVSMRGLAAAACIVLSLRPESLFEAGFQMSFAAAAALIAGYDVTRSFWLSRAQLEGVQHKIVTALIATSATSFIAGTATMPFAAYHFNRLVAYGLPANILATPVMGLWIMPAIILSAVLFPLGLSGAGLMILGWGIGYIVWVAEFVAGFEGAAWSVPSGSPVALVMITVSGLWLVIWRGPLRLYAILPCVSGLVLWSNTNRPDIIVSRDARLIGALSSEGMLWLSREKAATYSAETWLRRNGEGDVTQKQAYLRREWVCSRNECAGKTGNNREIILLRTDSAKNAEHHCKNKAILIAPHLSGYNNSEKDCTLIGPVILGAASSISVTLNHDIPDTIKIAAPHAFNKSQW